MGDVNHRLFVEKYRQLLRGPYLEVGSKDYGSTENLRGVVPTGEEYLGVDQEAGPGVDVVLDLTMPFEQIDARLGGRRFGTIFCMSVLEHCRSPQRMAENLTRLLRSGGVLFVSAPFAWKFHAYPNDYWRFTPEGVRLLFPRLWFAPEMGVWATARPGEFSPLDQQIGKIRFRTTPYRRQRRWSWVIGVALVRLLRTAGLLGFLKGFSYVLAPTNIMMV
ncbi:MAG TPA: methyltransferase domain-containing protein, partial [Thermoguttaceae bacterium]|nr:methyltransferase domain-containing protein [Thermoguttaceae bacterium]